MKERRQEGEVEGLHAKFHVNVFIGWLPVAENDNFWQILTFWGSCTSPLLPMRVKCGVLKQTERLHLHAKFHLNVFILSASNGRKPQALANFEIWGALVPTPFYL